MDEGVNQPGSEHESFGCVLVPSEGKKELIYVVLFNCMFDPEGHGCLPLLPEIRRQIKNRNSIHQQPYVKKTVLNARV